MNDKKSEDEKKREEKTSKKKLVKPISDEDAALHFKKLSKKRRRIQLHQKNLETQRRARELRGQSQAEDVEINLRHSDGGSFNDLMNASGAHRKDTLDLRMSVFVLQNEINKLNEKIHSDLKKFGEDKSKSQTDYEKLQTDHDELQKKEKLRHLIDRVSPSAQKELLGGGDLLELFASTERCNAYVMSIDLRRSTDLMLKARTPERFANFISTLAEKLRAAIVSEFGVFDKFTGDGVLAYFPDFYSGEHAGFRAIEVAEKCHEIFSEHYRANRNCFISILNGIGLGIGVDLGVVSMVQIKGELTVVGTPVVYACRLGGANAGQTLVNQPAYEELLDEFSEFIDFEETEIVFKHEGAMLAYAVRRNEKEADFPDPCWELDDDESTDIADDKSEVSDDEPEETAE